MTLLPTNKKHKNGRVMVQFYPVLFVAKITKNWAVISLNITGEYKIKYREKIGKYADTEVPLLPTYKTH